MKIYKAKVSYAMLLGLSLVFILPIIYKIVRDGWSNNPALFIGVMLFCYALIMHTFLMTRYTIDKGLLKVRFGLVYHKKVEIAEIRKIEKTATIMSSPAPSFDRIRVQIGKYDEVVISPENKLSFAKDLMNINPQIENLITED